MRKRNAGCQWMAILYGTLGSVLMRDLYKGSHNLQLDVAGMTLCPRLQDSLASSVELVSPLVRVPFTLNSVPGLDNKLCSHCEYRRERGKCFPGSLTSTHFSLWLTPFQATLGICGPRSRGPLVPQPCPYSSCPWFCYATGGTCADKPVCSFKFIHTCCPTAAQGEGVLTMKWSPLSGSWLWTIWGREFQSHEYLGNGLEGECIPQPCRMLAPWGRMVRGGRRGHLKHQPNLGLPVLPDFQSSCF